MIHYHFTSAQHFAKIQKSGIALGMIPWRLLPNGGVAKKRNFQWLTTNPDWEQSWDVRLKSDLPYRRTEYRIALEIPGFALRSLYRWPYFAQKYNPESATFLNSLGDSKNWSVFHGPIPAAWFIATERNPIPINLPQINESN